MVQVIKNINRIEYINALDLSGLTVVPDVGAFISGPNPFIAMPLVGLADCKVTTKTLDKVKYFTATLTATLYEPFRQKNRPMAFRLTTVRGEQFLLGTDQQPFPQIDTTDLFPGKPADKSGYQLTVERSDTFGLLKILG